MLSSIFAASLAFSASNAASACGLSDIDSCSNTSQLVKSPGFRSALAHFMGLQGKRHGSYLYANAPIVAQQMAVLTGAAGEKDRIGQLHRFTSYRSHSAQEQGAVVVSGNGSIDASAILWSPCALRDRTADCSKHSRLVVFVSKSNAQRERIVENLKLWATESVKKFYNEPNAPRSSLDGVIVVDPDSSRVHYTED